MESLPQFVLPPRSQLDTNLTDNSLQPSVSQYAYLQPSSSSNILQPRKRITDLSRNLIVIVCEYLAFFEIIALTSANKKLLSKLDDCFEQQTGESKEGLESGFNTESVSYVKRRGTLFFQNFFFQQFPSSDFFMKRMSQLTIRPSCLIAICEVGGDSQQLGLGYEARPSNSSNFLPFVKQSSICENKRYSMMPPTLSKQASNNPFDIGFDEAGYKRGSTVTTAITEKLIENQRSGEGESYSCEEQARPMKYIQETYKKWKDMYIEAIQNKSTFVNTHVQEFYTTFVSRAEDYAREIFLDPTQCENPTLALPQLTRENYNQKGLFYRTEKILVQNYSSCFQRYPVDYTKQLLWDVSQSMQTQLAKNRHARSILSSLLDNELQAINSELLIQPSLKKTNEMLSLLKSSEQNWLPPLPTLGNPQFSFNPFDTIPEMENLSLNPPELNSIPTFGPPPLLKQNIPQDFSLPTLEPPSLVSKFELVSFNSSSQIVTSSDSELTKLYKDVASYTFRQFKLICRAHRCQLEFILEQIKMAPSLRKSYFMYLEEYIQKERNLKYLMRKVSQNFIVQEAFQETMLRNAIYQVKETQKKPYLCDFLLLEYMDSIWMNEIYRNQVPFLVQHVKEEALILHTLERFEELADKKETLRKIVNIIHQTEFNIQSNEDFLSISYSKATQEDRDSTAFFKKMRTSKSSGEYLQASAFAQKESVSVYEELERHLQNCVKLLLKQMQRASTSLNAFMQYCGQYETYQFHKIQEVEYYYLLQKKHYMAKAFAQELSTKLETNRFTKAPQFGQAVNGFSSNISTSASSGSIPRSSSPKMSANHLNLHQVIHPELAESFFHQLLRRLMKDDKFKEYMDGEQLIQSLFVLFHIEPNSKSQFASDINRYLTEIHSQIDELLQQQPELSIQGSEFSDREESKFGDVAITINKVGSNETNGIQKVSSHGESVNQCPFSIIDEGNTGGDDFELNIENPPELYRGYSDQKHLFFKGLRSEILKNFKILERTFDFKVLIQIQRQEENRRNMSEIQQRIDHFNIAVQSYQQQAQDDRGVVPSTDSVIDEGGADLDIDDDDLPNPTMLQSPFNFQLGSSMNNIPIIGQHSSGFPSLLPPLSLQRSSNSFSFSTTINGDDDPEGTNYQNKPLSEQINGGNNDDDIDMRSDQQQ